jgi:predicted RNase H-like HicB family nuclease
MKIRVVVEYDSEINSYAVYCPELPGCASQGETQEAAINNIKEAIHLYFEPSPVELGPDDQLLELDIAA